MPSKRAKGTNPRALGTNPRAKGEGSRGSGKRSAWVGSYNAYLKSEHWQDVRKRYWASKLLKECYVCGRKDHLQLHHRTYKRVGCEFLRDLLPLCGDCHKGVHDLLKSKKYKDTLWTAARRYKRHRLKRVNSSSGL